MAGYHRVAQEVPHAGQPERNKLAAVQGKGSEQATADTNIQDESRWRYGV
jgi:hypothetical protein